MSVENKVALAQQRDPPEQAHTAQPLSSFGEGVFSLEEFAVMELEERRELVSCCGIDIFCSNDNCDCVPINVVCGNSQCGNAVCGNNACGDAVCVPDTYCGTNSPCGDNSYCDTP